MNNLPDKDELIELINTILAASANVKGVLAVPILIIPIKAAYWQKIIKSGTRSEETTLTFFRTLGIHGDRTKKNLEGYPGLLRDLLYPPPWINVEYEDVFEPLTEERSDDLRSLFPQVKARGADDLLSSFRDHLADNQALRKQVLGHPVTEAQRYAMDVRIDYFARTLELADCISEDEFDNILDAVFDIDEFVHSNGVPDLLIWDSDTSIWFFAEVKGPGDSIRDNQKEWIRANWNSIKGRMLFISLDVFG